MSVHLSLYLSRFCKGLPLSSKGFFMPERCFAPVSFLFFLSISFARFPFSTVRFGFTSVSTDPSFEPSGRILPVGGGDRTRDGISSVAITIVRRDGTHPALLGIVQRSISSIRDSPHRRILQSQDYERSNLYLRESRQQLRNVVKNITNGI